MYTEYMLFTVFRKITGLYLHHGNTHTLWDVSNFSTHNVWALCGISAYLLTFITCQSNITLFLEKMSLIRYIMRELKCACNPILYHIQTFPHCTIHRSLSLSPNSSQSEQQHNAFIFNDNSSSSFGRCDHHSPPPNTGWLTNNILYITYTRSFTWLRTTTIRTLYYDQNHIALWKTTVPILFSNYHKPFRRLPKRTEKNWIHATWYVYEIARKLYEQVAES